MKSCLRKKARPGFEIIQKIDFIIIYVGWGYYKYTITKRVILITY